MLGAAVKIHPFESQISCPKCGAGEVPTTTMTQPIPGGLSFPVLIPTAPGSMTTLYCAGGKEPEDKTPDVTDVGEMFNSVFSKLSPGLAPALRPKLNICAGISQEHLHRICSNCSFELLMETKDARHVCAIHPIRPEVNS